MIIERLRAVLSRDEGCELEVYQLNGIPHIGYGINLIAGVTDEQLEYLGVEDEDDIESITQEQADWLLDSHIEEFTHVCESTFRGYWDGIESIRQEVLLNVALNVGSSGFPKFRRMIAAVKEHDWDEASKQMLDSHAAKQTGKRYDRLAQVMKTADEKYFEVEYEGSVSVSQPTPQTQGLETGSVTRIENKIDELAQRVDNISETLGEILEKLSGDVKKAKPKGGFF